MNQALRYARKGAKAVAVLALAGYFIPKTLVFFLACGLLDVRRNGWTLATLDRYFLGNGVTVWLLSPLNLLVDLITIPYWNKGVYGIEDLPDVCQQEIRRVVRVMEERRIVAQLEPKLREGARSMIFFKWHGRNFSTSIDAPEFHESYQYVRTIGVSVLDRRSSTSEHFGPLRLTLRVLYNLNPLDSDDVFIRVGRRRHLWRDDPLFIFDDTLAHQSVNGSDERRYCLFVDVARPSPLPGLMRAIVTPLQLMLVKINGVFYKNWTFIE